MTGLARSASRLSGAIAPFALALAPKCPLCLLPVAAVVGAALPPQPVLDALVVAAAAAWLVLALAVSRSASARAAAVAAATLLLSGRLLGSSAAVWAGCALMYAVAFARLRARQCLRA